MVERLVLGVLMCGLIAAGCVAADARQRGAGHRSGPAESRASVEDLGPQMQAYLGFLDAEEAELQHLYDTGEVPADDYKQSMDRILATRAAAIRLARERENDDVPDLYVLRGRELTQVLPAGLAAVKGKRAGDRINSDWVYHGTIRRGDLFYILERTAQIPRDTSL